jgi:hypothetical protein
MDEVKVVEENSVASGIAEVKTFIDLEGRQIKQFAPIDGSSVINKGLATVNTAQGHQPFEFNYPDGYSVEKCFEEFDKEAAEQLEVYKSQIVAKQNEIVVPK